MSSAISPPNPTAGPVAVLVEVNYRGTGNWEVGSVLRTHKDDSIDVHYEKLGETERRVPVDRIRPHRSSSSRRALQRQATGPRRDRSISPARSHAEDKSSSRSPAPIEVKSPLPPRSDAQADAATKGGNSSSRKYSKPVESEASDIFIEVNYRGLGVWAPAKLVRENRDGSIDVLYYKSGEQESSVPIDRVRPGSGAVASPMAAASSKAQVKSPTPEAASTATVAIEALYHMKKNDWRAAQIVKENKNGTVDVRFTAEGEEQCGLPVAAIRLAADRTSAAAAPAPAHAPAHAPAQTPTSFDVGTAVEVNYRSQGVWVAGEVKRDRRDDTYDIKYNEDEFETRVPLSRIRLPQRKKAAKPAPGTAAASAAGGAAARPHAVEPKAEASEKERGKKDLNETVQLSRQEVETLKKLLLSKDAEIQKLKAVREAASNHVTLSPTAPKTPPPSEGRGRHKRSNSFSAVEDPIASEQDAAARAVPKLQKKRSQDDLYVHRTEGPPSTRQNLSDLPEIRGRVSKKAEKEAREPTAAAAHSSSSNNNNNNNSNNGNGGDGGSGSAHDAQLQMLQSEVAKLTKANAALVTGMQTLTKKLSTVIEEVGALRSRTDKMSKTLKEQEQEIAELKSARRATPTTEKSTGRGPSNESAAEGKRH